MCDAAGQDQVPPVSNHDSGALERAAQGDLLRWVLHSACNLPSTWGPFFSSLNLFLQARGHWNVIYIRVGIPVLSTDVSRYLKSACCTIYTLSIG